MTPLQQKTSFVNTAGAAKAPAAVNTIKAPKKRLMSLDQPDATTFKCLLFGTPGSGKTKALADLLQGGYKVFILSTDMGGDGFLTIQSRLTHLGCPELLSNCKVLPIREYITDLDNPKAGYLEVEKFLSDPAEYCPDLLEFDPDFAAWDGFGTFQQVDVSEYVGAMAPAKDKDRGDFRESGLVLETQDWGAICNATMRCFNKFTRIHNVSPTGKKWHKIFTAHEGIVYKKNALTDKQEASDSRKPMLAGKGGTMVEGGVDLVVRCKTIKGLRGKTEYKYVVRGDENNSAKVRLQNLEDEEPADFLALWKKIEANLPKGQTA